MSYLNLATDEIVNGVQNALRSLDEGQVEKILEVLLEARNHKILVVGMGRSGLVGRAFAMRLMHLGFDVHIVGETITPALVKGDLLFSISGSGTTTFVMVASRMAKRVGAGVIAVTSHLGSPLGKLADHVVVVKGRTKLASKRDYFSRQILGIHEPLAPLGTIFETSCMIFLDGIVAELMHRMNETETNMRKRHATIE